ncbi:MAG: outer membrane lipoprotein carrier protein LolA [Bacteroidales bacterium]|nr:outer membrane lipoprotein carrier protein LolA [Bacteroidales bacterium]
MRKHLMLIISILTLATNTFAQNAEQVFKAAVDKLKAYDNIEIAFDYQMINTTAGIDELMTGTGHLQGDSYKLNIAGQEMICNGSTLWTYMPDSQEVMVSSVDSEDGGSPLSVINSYYDNINAKFLPGSDPSKTTIEVTPKEKDENFNKLVVVAETKTMNLKEVHLFDNNGSEFVYSITKFITNQILPDNFFIFNEEDYPGAEIIDMR